MAHFYATVESTRKPVTKTGTKSTGMEAHVRGWNVGCKVVLEHENGKDIVRVYRTAGSAGHGRDILITEYSESELIEKAS